MSQTKIFVIHMKELIIGLVIAVILIILTILALVCFGGKSSSNTNNHVSQSTHSSDKSAVTSNGNGGKSGSNSSNTYMPGIYTSSISVNGTPLEIQVTVDENNINAVELKNLSESVTTMYPMMQTSFQELANQVVKNGSIENVSYSADNKYTATMLLQGIQQALDKCIQQ
ncbi:MAG: hypothetical protein PHW47_06830 [Lachnospira sp.]|nr:hypothetical protein [Lachnospira sp.]